MTTASKITLLRIFLIPVYMVLMLSLIHISEPTRH